MCACDTKNQGLIQKNFWLFKEILKGFHMIELLATMVSKSVFHDAMLAIDHNSSYLEGI